MKRYWKIVVLSVLVFAVIIFSSAPMLIDHHTAQAFHPFGGETVVIDAGHGGEDGGAISVTGAAESHINLAIALKLDQICGLYGIPAILLRSEDVSLHDSDSITLRQKKISDLKNRVKIIESVENPVLISIHQNTYIQSRFHGAQVFYANGDLSLPLAQLLQDTIKQYIDPSNERKPAKISDNVYIMNHISCKAILLECGFISNPQEDILLQTSAYQTKIAAALATAYQNYQLSNQEGDPLNGV